MLMKTSGNCLSKLFHEFVIIIYFVASTSMDNNIENRTAQKLH